MEMKKKAVMVPPQPRITFIKPRTDLARTAFVDL